MVTFHFSLFLFFYFMFSAPISFMFSNFSISSLFFKMLFLKPLSSIVENLLYTYIYKYV